MRGGCELGLALLVLLVDLFEEIAHTDRLRPSAEVERHFDRRPDLVGVHVTVPESVAADHDDRVTDLAPAFLELADVLVGQVEEVHHLVALLADIEFAGGVGVTMRDEVEGLTDRTRRAVVGLGDRQRFTVDDVEHRIQQQQEPGSAGIDDTGVLQHLQLLGRVVEGELAGGTRCTHDVDERSAGVGGGLGAICALSAHREDRALDRLEHCVVGAGGCGLERLGELHALDVGVLFHRAGEPAHDLAEDHTAVAACAHERTMADRIAGGVVIVVVLRRPSRRPPRRACGPCSFPCRHREPGTRSGD